MSITQASSRVGGGGVHSHSSPPNSTMILIKARRKLAFADHTMPGAELYTFTWINPFHAIF